MDLLQGVPFFLGVVAYTVAATLFFLDIARREGLRGGVLWARRALLLGAGLHTVHLVGSSFVLHVCPVASTPFALSFFALITCGAYLLLAKRPAVSATGVVVAPVALVSLVGAQFVGQGGSAPELPRTLLAFHIAANLLGLGFFLLAGAVGAFYLVQERRLKQHRLTFSGGRLPALDVLDSAEHFLLLAGFPLLTFGIVTGAVFMSHLGEHSVAAQLRAALAYVAWGLLAFVLVMRAIAGWRGRRAAYGTLLGVGCVLLVLLGYVVRAGSVRGGASNAKQVEVGYEPSKVFAPGLRGETLAGNSTVCDPGPSFLSSVL
jgi:ABC-type uncharacterized transport system permease subunit